MVGERQNDATTVIKLVTSRNNAETLAQRGDKKRKQKIITHLMGT